MNEKDIVDETEPAVPWTQSKNGTSGMSKIVIEMASLFLNYNIEVVRLTEKHEHGVRENLSGRVDLAKADPVYTVR